MIKIKIKFFGILKDYFKDIEIDINNQITLFYIKDYIIENCLDDKTYHLKETIKKSIFSNNNKLLHDKIIIKTSCTIFLLPPFSGG